MKEFKGLFVDSITPTMPNVAKVAKSDFDAVSSCRLRCLAEKCILFGVAGQERTCHTFFETPDSSWPFQREEPSWGYVRWVCGALDAC